MNSRCEIDYACRPLLSPGRGTEAACHIMHGYIVVQLHVAAKFALFVLFFQIESKIIMSRLFQQFIVQLPKDYELHIEQKITLEPKDGVNCTLKMRGK